MTTTAQPRGAEEPALPLSYDGLFAVDDRALDLIHAVVTAPYAQVGLTKKQVVWRKNKARLYHYTRATPATQRTPVLLVMPLINRAYILDLRPGQSFVEFLLRQGYEVFLLDWGVPGDEDRGLDITALVTRYLPRAARRARQLTGGGPLTVLGYCIGGVLATCFAALDAERGGRGDVKNLVLFTTPIDFSDAGLFGQWTAEGVFPIDLLCDTYPVVPSTFPETGSKMLAPLATTLGVLVKLRERLEKPGMDMAGWQAMYRWVNEGVPFPGAAYRQWIKEFYQGNRLYKGSLRLGDRAVRLSSITVPLLNVVATADTIAPRPTTSVILDAVDSEDTQELLVKGGHVGIVVGKAAQAELWPRVDQWLRAHDGARRPD